jgi:RHH-type proline utilization regulon transcriptional repressor/proline dehydrogenase/delta 1-pyrroline-5-carboxylate dehydrogenase
VAFNFSIFKGKIMIFAQALPTPTPLRKAITEAYRMDETQCVKNLLKNAELPSAAKAHIHEVAEKLVIGTREKRKQQGKLDSFLHQYDLSTDEGIALMCLAEALLRIPDHQTVDLLISDKISTANWHEHLDRNQSLFVNAATWSLILTGKIYSPTLNYQKSLGNTLKKFISKTGGVVIRPIIMQGMKIIGKQFVMGRNIDEAIERAKENEAKGYRYSYDMLGESARTAEDAEKYFQSYRNAIAAIGKASANLDPINGPGISIKLSALHPRYEVAKHERVMKELVPLLLQLAREAKEQNIGLTVDAEEADRLEISLDVIEAVFSDPSLNNWEGFGLAVQAYQKRAPFVIDWLADLSKKHKKRFMVRLIKGAYWDAEIKMSQLLGLDSYPVFTRKNSTDVSYIACAKKLLAQPDCFYPQFGTHNAYSVAAVLEIANGRRDFEFQCLHGMGNTLYDNVVGKNNLDVACRIYAPVGTHQDLLGYLVRRLLENGANTSFINLLADLDMPMDKIILDPVERIAALPNIPHPRIPLPKNIYGSRNNSSGIDLSNTNVLTQLKKEMEKSEKAVDFAVKDATAEDIEKALHQSVTHSWGDTTVEERAACLERAADLFEKNMPRLMTFLTLEGKKCIADCVSEVREAVDFCRYYAARAREDLLPKNLTGPTGEFNQLSHHPRGTILCISPWNFPLAIFTGQVVAALVAGNSVIAKPAEQTPKIAIEAVKLLHEAGIPKEALHCLTGRGETVGAKLVADLRTAGIMFTGSTETAKIIQKTLANREGPIIPLIAETGGMNAMIVDSSALPEQVVADVIQSAFNSAGQRCSALRILFLQEDVAPKILAMLKGAMEELTVGEPSLLSTDIGPVIDEDAFNMLKNHAEKMRREATFIYQVPIKKPLQGNYFAPCLFELSELSILKREVFGPILHVIRYNSQNMDKILDDIINTGYGLTLGIHSRIDATVNHIQKRMPVGNVYVNRNMIGAVVGVQPFGGEGLSGTGPKAGGPHYLPRLCVERSISVNTTAAGGNASLVSLHEESDDS